MAIVRMTGREKLGQPGTFELNDYHGAEKGRVFHDSKCAHANKYDMSGAVSPECNSRCRVSEGLVMERTHEGLVLSVGEHNYRDDSDFFAMVWDDAAGKPVEVSYGTTRAWTYPNSATVDATPEVQAKAQAWYEAREQERRERERLAYQEREARTPVKGKRMKVVRGRKVPVGTEGVVFFIRDGRVGLALDDSKDAQGRFQNVAWVNADYLYEV